VTFEKVKEVRAVLTSGTPLAEGEAFQILAITAGEGNGWVFPADVLRASLPLWEGVETFIAHAAGSRSVRDLAGVCAAPVYDEAQQGVRLDCCGSEGRHKILQHLGSASTAYTFQAQQVFHSNGQPQQGRQIPTLRPAVIGCLCRKQSIFLNQGDVGVQARFQVGGPR